MQGRSMAGRAARAVPTCCQGGGAGPGGLLRAVCLQVVWNAYLSTLSHAPELDLDPSTLAEKVGRRLRPASHASDNWQGMFRDHVLLQVQFSA